MRVFALLLSAGFMLLGCGQQVAKEKRYLNMDSLVSEQISLLTERKASVKKDATIGKANNSSSAVMDSTAWSHELDVFRQLDLINRPIYKDAYVVKDGVKDSKSNLLIRSFEASSTSAVPYVRLYYQNTPARLRKLEALYQENNSLYGSHRKLEMYFDDGTGTTCLKGYLITGTQKMILTDSVRYLIRSEVVFP